ncbi:hypothetical protein B0T24DRAFT_684538 [Lasiosphaeria ovina]|uniref:Uncharacterized protein n=1 Tax=Lasiosphaeria ovina TaxID=92902 RepID=A0AAE0JTF5_9PEZI|nr:hypothetical protein B0T24DRAFT_684538 [Lasiosphaeria ovina]
MAEGLAAVSLVNDGVALCSKAVAELKKFTHAEKDLKRLIQHVEQVRQSNELLSMAMTEMADVGYKDLTLSLEPFLKTLRTLIDEIMARASEIAAGQPKLGFMRRILWTLGSSTTEGLVKRLKDAQADVMRNVHLISVWAQMRNLSLTKNTEDKKRQSETHPELLDAFSDITLVNSEGGERAISNPMMRTWAGQIRIDSHEQQYQEYREGLADAAKYGSWDDMFRLIDIGCSVYGESWVNSSRLKPLAESGLVAGWAPLHQAVYMRAPLEVTQKLIDLGASRTLRTLWTEFDWDNMSALELALHLDVCHLIPVLRPVIHMPIPKQTLQLLEKHFHDLIQHELGNAIHDAMLHLPELEVLTEFEPTPTWFPIRIGDRHSGYMYQLDARHLLVRSVNVQGNGIDIKYRITEEEILIVDEALVFAYLQ